MSFMAGSTQDPESITHVEENHPPKWSPSKWMEKKSHLPCLANKTGGFVLKADSITLNRKLPKSFMPSDMIWFTS